MDSGVNRVSMVVLRQKDLSAGVYFYRSLGLKELFYLEEKWVEFALPCIKIALCPK